MRIQACVCVIVLSGVASDAEAQWWDRGFMGGFHASTAAEGYARGMADVTRSAGAANLLNAQAAVEGEQAISANLDNRLKAAETYFNMQTENRAFRASMRKPPLTSDQAAHLARSRAPAPLSSSDFDPVSGAIAWPGILKDDQYSKFTKPLDVLFQQKSDQGGGVSVKQFNEIRDLTGGLTGSLKQNIRNYRSSDYLRARNFIESLLFETQLN